MRPRDAAVVITGAGGGIGLTRALAVDGDHSGS